jgi:hypothetical protein
MFSLVFSVLLKSHVLIVRMQDLDSFISPIPGFEGDILIPTIPISAHSPGSEAIEDSSTESSAAHRRLELKSGKQLPTRLPRRKPTKLPGSLHAGFRLMNLFPKHLV